MIFTTFLEIDILTIYCENDLIWMSQNLIGDRSTSV